ncbi:ParB/RepB/Spo0J family partition protein [Prevotella sp. MA2016]|uniref:ParB/RepB/Spo0J family partition protein n=1 Tax=Prevotella sp. MA2016 TaxID=1408310 RepID=UPI0004904D49|nr:ParB/RepB/Spo0J family partition protein [Prevotella sp. MA2016]
MAVRKKYDHNVLGRGLDNIGTGRGMGLDALINTNDINTKGTSNLNEIAIELIEPNPDQPRHEFDENALNELAASIREIGIITPITVREMPTGHYQIIAGERRWRASQIAGLTTMPAYIKTTDDKLTMEMALVENIQREDLNAIEIALAYQRLAESTGMTQERMSERLGKSRASITNYMRLLKLPAQIQMALKNRDIDMGHARALLSLESPSAQLKLFKDVHRNGYSVRKVEEMVQMVKNGNSLQNARKTIAPNQLPLEYSILRDRLSELFQVKVQMTCTPQSKGRISIPFTNEDELENILNIFDKLKKK